MPKTGRSSLDILAVAAVAALFVAFALAANDLASTIYAWVAPPLAVFAAVACAAAAMRALDRSRAVWAFLALGATAWTGAELAGSAYRLAGTGEPPTTLVDTARIAAAVLFTLALAVYVSSTPLAGRARSALGSVLDAAVAGSALLFVAEVAVLQPLADSSAGDGLTPAHAIANAVLLTGALFAASRSHRDNRVPVLVLAAAAAAATIAPTASATLIARADNEVHAPLLAGWLAAYALVGLAARRSGRTTYGERDTHRVEVVRSSLPAVAPAISGVVAIAKLGAGSRLEGLSLMVGGAAMLLFIARYLVLARDSARLAESADAGLSQQMMAVQSSEERFRALVQNASEVITLLDAQGSITYQNDAVTRVFGVSPGELVDIKFAEWVHPADRGRFEALVSDLARHPGSHDRIAVRLQRHDGRWAQSEIELANMQHEPSVGGLVLSVRDATDRLVQHRRPDHEVSIDELTGLPNLRLFTRVVGDAVAQRLTPAIVALDIDHFGELNESIGTDIGDRVLREVGRQLKSCVRGTDFIARIGADEFCVLVMPGDTGTDPGPVVERMEEVLAEFATRGGLGEFTAAIGIAQGVEGQRADAIVSAALAALEAAKGQGRGGRAVFDESLAAAEQAKNTVANELRESLRRGDLLFAYQPSVDLADGSLEAVVAGFRWTHPTRGRIGAAEVLSIAEEAGVIDRLTWWMLEEVCRVGVSWQAKLGPRPITLRLSPKHAVSGLATLVTDLVADTELPAGGLVLEILGPGAEGQVAELGRTVEQLRGLGVKVALDDLHDGSIAPEFFLLPPTEIERVDEDEDAANAVRARIVAAHDAGIRTIADGVSREAQVNMLKSAGCDVARGPAFGSPVSQERFEQALGLAGDAAPSRLPAGGMRVRPLG